MTLFTDDGFQNGRWAGSLAKLLRPLRFIPELVPKGRLWRGNWRQWIQFEPSQSIGPVFWMGKASIRSSANALYVGYYIERGVSWAKDIKPEYILTEAWHWHGFMRCMKNSSLSKLLFELPENRRCIWIESEEINLDEYISYKNENSFKEAEKIINEISDKNWVNVMIGNSYSKDECLDSQRQLVQELRNPIVRAYEIDDLVKNSIESEETK